MEYGKETVKTMKHEVKNIKGVKVTRVEFNSIAELVDFVKNESPKFHSLSSKNGSFSFTQTKNFDEAVNLLTKGWTDKTEQIVSKMKTIKFSKNEMKEISKFDVAGYQCCVPRYLQGVPDSMIAKKKIPQKQKIVKLTKSVGYNCGVPADTIFENSVKAFKLIEALEKNGQRCELTVNWVTARFSERVEVYLKLKSPNERLNVSKMAFPMCHPSMLRRIMFAVLERLDDVNIEFNNGYGRSITNTKELSECVREYKNDVFVIPSFIEQDVTKITNIEDLK